MGESLPKGQNDVMSDAANGIRGKEQDGMREPLPQEREEQRTYRSPRGHIKLASMAQRGAVLMTLVDRATRRELAVTRLMPDDIIDLVDGLLEVSGIKLTESLQWIYEDGSPVRHYDLTSDPLVRFGLKPRGALEG